jgi:hypothetical protein
MQHLLLFHFNNGCTKTPQYYVIRTLPFLSNLHESGIKPNALRCISVYFGIVFSFIFVISGIFMV